MADEDKEVERVYVVPLRKAKVGRSSLAAPRSVKIVRSFLTRHMKVKDEDIWIDDSLNKALWSKGKYKTPGKIRVRAVKFEDGVVEASLPELGFKKSRRELLKEEKEKKEPILRKEVEAEEGEVGEGVAGAEDYEIAPAAEGEVKIKKKKAPKKKKEKKEEEAKKPVKKKKKVKEKKKSEKKAEKKVKEKKKSTAKKKKTSLLKKIGKKSQRPKRKRQLKKQKRKSE